MEIRNLEESEIMMKGCGCMAKKQMRLFEDEIKFINCIRECNLSADDVSCILISVSFDDAKFGDLVPIFASWQDKVDQFKHTYFRGFIHKGDA
jgi:hypothetical protein